nr:LYR motif-containing protein 2 isoform X2 [Halyomorpha halys]
MSVNGKAMLSLKEFFLRKKVLKLYKDILLCIREVPSQEDQKELREWVRRDFKANKYHKDQYAIKSLLKYGERSLKELRQNLEFTRPGC